MTYEWTTNRLDGESLVACKLIRMPSYGETIAHHSCFHRSDSLVFGIMRYIRCGMEEVVDSVPGVSADDRAAIGACHRFAIRSPLVPEAGGWNGIQAAKNKTHIALPRSRKRAPGLQSLMASSRLSRVVRMSFFDSSSISPTGYVSLRSP